MNIAITDSSYKHSLGIVRSLGKDGYKPYILTTEKKSLCSYSKFSNKEIIIDKNFDSELLVGELLRNKIELLILVGTDSFKKIVPWKKKLLKNNINIISVDEETLNIAFSKKETYALAKKIGVPIAKTFYPKTFNDIDMLKNEITYPCVIKGLFEVGGNIVDYANNAIELKRKYFRICEKYDIQENDGLPMLQEYIEGKGCAFFAVYNKGICGLTFQHQRVREYPVSGGASVCARSYRNESVEKYGRLLLDSLKWHGVAMVEFKLNSDGVPILMEINPKFWGSTDLALEAGVNFPKALVDIHKGKEVLYSNQYKFPFKYHWLLDGELKHAISNPKAIPAILIDTINPRTKGNIWLSDPMPTVYRIKEIFTGLFKKVLSDV